MRVHNVIESVVFGLKSDYTVDLVTTCSVYSWSLEVDWPVEECNGWYPCSSATGKVSFLPDCSISGQTWLLMSL